VPGNQPERINPHSFNQFVGLQEKPPLYMVDLSGFFTKKAKKCTAEVGFLIALLNSANKKSLESNKQLTL